MTKPFELTDRQKEGRRLLGGKQTHTLFFGGSRSGKTFLIEYAKAVRAIRAPGSRHLMARHHNIDVRQSVLQDTFPKMMRLAFPGVEYSVNKSDQFVSLTNGSELWYTGLDDKERVEKILGKEYATIAVNEVSQVSYPTIETLRTRLAQAVYTDSGQELPLRGYYDLNPTGKTHWTYKEFVQKVKPTGEVIEDPDDFAYLVLNPADNPHLPKAYLRQLAGLSARQKKRFLHGEYLSDVPGALWTTEIIEKNRVPNVDFRDMDRIVVAVDPPGSSDLDSDEAGIVVAGVKGRGPASQAYVFADRSRIATPLAWGKATDSAYTEFMADAAVVEKNQGGEMAVHTLKTANPNMRVKTVWASRSKDARAEPIAALYEDGRVHHVGVHQGLEDQMTSWVPGDNKSPDRVDALVWALTELMLGGGPSRTMKVKVG